MTNLPPSPFFDSGVPDCPPGEAATALRQVEAVAADLPDDLSCIGEIFVGASKLADPDEHRFMLDEQAFMDAIDEPPLFLRRAIR
jgi:hypothetical protein